MKLINPQGRKVINVAASENLYLYLEDFSAEKSDFSLIVNLTGEDSKCQIEGRISTTKKQQKKWVITQNIQNSYQKASMDIRGFSAEKSSLEIDGQVIVGKEGLQADVNVDEQILLFDEGRANITPFLDVNLASVKSASHSASISPINRQLLFFLQSRGISHEEALIMIKDGFMSITE